MAKIVNLLKKIEPWHLALVQAGLAVGLTHLVKKHPQDPKIVISSFCFYSAGLLGYVGLSIKHQFSDIKKTLDPSDQISPVNRLDRTLIAYSLSETVSGLTTGNLVQASQGVSALRKHLPQTRQSFDKSKLKEFIITSSKKNAKRFASRYIGLFLLLPTSGIFLETIKDVSRKNLEMRIKAGDQPPPLPPALGKFEKTLKDLKDTLRSINPGHSF
jgi:hypothetical protein